MGIKFSERKKKILDLLERDGKVEVPTLANILSISEITIRRDLEKLDSGGLLIKTYGGAVKREPSLFEFIYNRNRERMVEEKKRIGIHAAKMVTKGDVAFLDTGTTTLQVARALKEGHGITIITNSLLILTELKFSKDINVILLGGNYRVGSLDLSGPLTQRAMEGFRAKLAFVGTDGITVEDGATTGDIYTAKTTELMVKYCERAIVVADHTKIGKRGATKYADIEDIDTLITDKSISAVDIARFEKKGLKVEVA